MSLRAGDDDDFDLEFGASAPRRPETASPAHAWPTMATSPCHNLTAQDRLLGPGRRAPGFIVTYTALRWGSLPAPNDVGAASASIAGTRAQRRCHAPRAPPWARRCPSSPLPGIQARSRPPHGYASVRASPGGRPCCFAGRRPFRAGRRRCGHHDGHGGPIRGGLPRRALSARLGGRPLPAALGSCGGHIRNSQRPLSRRPPACPRGVDAQCSLAPGGAWRPHRTGRIRISFASKPAAAGSSRPAAVPCA